MTALNHRDKSQKTRRLLSLGPSFGWHAERLRAAANRRGLGLAYAPYESLCATIDASGNSIIKCQVGNLHDFSAVLCRTMPSGSLEQISFRLATLHAAFAAGLRIVNPPRTLELAIDKYATLDIVAKLGYPVPETIVVQNRQEAIEAFRHLGGDIVVKPIFGGEGKGVMRIQDPQLAWYTFSTLEKLNAVLYLQRFVPPGGRDIRMFVIGEQILGIRRTNEREFRTNVAVGGRAEPTALGSNLREMGRCIADSLSLGIGSVDVIDCPKHSHVVVEVNAVPGWKGAQSCFGFDLADAMIDYLINPKIP